MNKIKIKSKIIVTNNNVKNITLDIRVDGKTLEEVNTLEGRRGGR